MRVELTVRVSGLFIDQNAVIVRDARDGDRSWVGVTDRPPALRLQCVTTIADFDIPTAILERTWLVHPLKIQVTFPVRNPLNQDPRVVERPVDAAALCIEVSCLLVGSTDHTETSPAKLFRTTTLVIWGTL